LGIGFIERNGITLSDQLPSFASRRVIRPPSDPKSSPPRHGNQDPNSNKRKFVRWGIKGVAIVAGAVLAVAGISAFDLYSQLNRDNIVLADVGEIDLNGPLNILVVGSDTREGQGEEFGQTDSELADVIMLLHISKDRKDAVVVSFPRDLLVSIPECPNPDGDPFPAKNRRQINASIGFGGVACTHLTVQEFTGLEIPFVAMIDFKGVIEMSNAIGGVEVVIDKPISDAYSNFYIEAGTHTLKGAEALGFLRTRHGVGDGSDLARISNQQLFLMSLFNKIKDDGTLSNPLRLYSLSSAAARNMKLSESMTDIGTMVTLAGAMRDVDSSKMVFTQVPTRVLSGSEEGRLESLSEEAKALFGLIRNDLPVVLEPSPSP
jgi:LCP family protein required for cell wall assembly